MGVRVVNWWTNLALANEPKPKRLVFHVNGREYETEEEAQRAANGQPIEALPSKREMN